MSAVAAARSPRAWAVFLSVVVGVTALDLASKRWAFARVAGAPVHLEPSAGALEKQIPRHAAIPLVPGVLALHLTVNTGAVFGLFQGTASLLVPVSVGAAALLLWFFARSDARHWGFHLALALVLAGALGNLYDRLRFEGVRDLFWLFPGTELWPWVFNVADAALTVGVAGILLRPGSPRERGDETARA
jgi:signal peptidase II